MSIGFSAFLLGSRRDQGDDEGGDADRDVDVERPLPGEVVDEVATEQWTGDSREAEDGTERSHVLATLIGGDDVGDDRLRQDHQTTTAETLQCAEHDEHPEVGGERAADRGEGEQRDRDQEEVAPTQDVAELAVDGHHDGGREQVGGGDPHLVVDAAELPDDRRHGGGDDGLVEAGEQHARDEGAEDDPDAALREQEGRILRGGDGHSVGFL